MKNKSTSQSAFFNLRVLIGLFVALTGVSLALLATANPSGWTFGASSHARTDQAQQKYNPFAGPGDISILPPGFDCSQIHRLHLDVQENFRAHLIMVACGVSEGGKGKPSPAHTFSKFVKSLLPSPLAYGGTDVDVVVTDGTFPAVVQSETYTIANPDDPTQVFVAYNDSSQAPGSFSAGAFSTDGGTTFTDIHAFPSTFGDPVVLYNHDTATWYTIWIDGNAGCTLGGFKTTDPLNGPWTHFCVHSGVSDDRESGWVDNNPASPFHGRMYVSWNDFGTSCGAGGCLFETFSSDGGATWSTPVEVQTNTAIFSRDVQITGDLAGGGNVYIASMDEGGGGFPHNDTNYIFKSTDGGVTWTNTYVGTPFPGPGVTASGYFACMFAAGPSNAYWRHEGWGEPAAINNFVHLVYAQHGTGSDPGDVYYIRSTDGGVTFGTPFKLNSDTTDRPQWQPNLSVSPSGTLLATWYDARVSADTDCVYGSPTSPCYQMFSRKSNDNGATWLPDDTLSDVVSPLPGQFDPNIQPTYAGDYDYGTAITTKHMTSWDDGRVAISGNSQQDVFTDRDLVGFSVATANPACGSLVIGTATTDFQIILSAPADPTTVQPTDFTVNGTPADMANLSNANQTIDFIFNSSPVTPGSNTMNIPAGAILQASNGDPILEFNCTFRYTQVQLTVTDTVPPVGGTFNPPAPSTYTYDVNWNKAVDPTSVQTTDLQLSGNTGASVTAVTVTNGGTTTEFTLNSPFGGSLTAHIAAGAITDTNGNPNADFSGNYAVGGCPPSWSAGPDLPTVLIRAVGVFFPDGNFYTVGGRTSDLAGSDFQHVLKFDTTSNTWSQMPSTLADNQGNNMGCGVLTVSGTPLIYCVGGSAAGQTTAAARVYSYDPATDTQTVLTAADNWPGDAAGTILPGGFAVANNKFYILGGFNINVASTNQIWEFDPNAAVGARWAPKMNTPEGVMYAPTCSINGIIYVGGASDYQGGTVVDTTNSFSFDPATNTLGTIAPIPRATGETRGLNFNGKMY